MLLINEFDHYLHSINKQKDLNKLIIYFDYPNLINLNNNHLLIEEHLKFFLVHLGYDDDFHYHKIQLLLYHYIYQHYFDKFLLRHLLNFENFFYEIDLNLLIHLLILVLKNLINDDYYLMVMMTFF